MPAEHISGQYDGIADLDRNINSDHGDLADRGGMRLLEVDLHREFVNAFQISNCPVNHSARAGSSRQWRLADYRLRSYARNAAR